MTGMNSGTLGRADDTSRNNEFVVHWRYADFCNEKIEESHLSERDDMCFLTGAELAKELNKLIKEEQKDAGA